MKRNDFISGLEQALFDNQQFDGHNMEEVMKYIEEHMKPKQYIHPRAIAEGLTDPKWGYVEFLDKYPKHHFRFDIRPYEYYVDGWEKEDEA